MSFIPYELYTAMKAALDEATQDVKDRMAKGKWKSEAEARQYVGMIEGLGKARLLLQDEYEKMERLEEERDE